eukprot:scaffold280420_cov401-Cyclotella_meneghiniana.AAC.1
MKGMDTLLPTTADHTIHIGKMEGSHNSNLMVPTGYTVNVMIITNMERVGTITLHTVNMVTITVHNTMERVGTRTLHIPHHLDLPYQAE